MLRAMDYALVKSVHVLAVALSIGLFVVRAAWALQGSARLQQTWVRVVPHVIDTVLLVSALWLAWQFSRAPGVAHGWLAAKLVGLVIYVIAGTLVIKRARGTGAKAVALLVALLTFAYIVAVAFAKSPAPWA